MATLWPDDAGTLDENSRRALVELIKGPYLSGRTSTQLWSALLADESAIRSRLNDLFLDVVIDRVGEFAFVKNIHSDEIATPRTVRSQNLTFIDTAMLLVLRQILLAGQSDARVIVGRDDVFERLRVYRTNDRDELDFERRLNAAWVKMRNKLRIIHSTGNRGDEEDRVEISPVLRLIVDADQVRQISAEYRRIAASDITVSELFSDELSDDDLLEDSA
ncbi:DUF4194 domain-containing protein [Subtercola endophyticus]|uniref:DUF4194 domain-containing protein n=1 Tax=Subtercola endophyticus TaxID=2895559 RepID=UPI001E2EFC4B|nr:DUF4194 domain-containing protein [Subtercola endophyticus]UFS57576.1 DUF4194 domain-containing protein [Subtercola endophyticus]